MRMRLLAGTLLLLLLGLVVQAYQAGLNGPFVFDDYPNIVENPGIAMLSLDGASLSRALAANDSGPLGRPLASLSFALNHLQAGGTAVSFPYKLFNLIIHLLNTLLVYVLVRALLRVVGYADQSWQWALLAAGLWALHPLQLTSVLYVVQRMTSLSALAVLVGLNLYVIGRERLARGRNGVGWMWAGWVLGLGLGLSAKENAALLPLLMLVLEWSIWSRHGIPPAVRRFFLLGLLLPAGLAVAWLFINPGFLLEAYVYRDYSLSERLLTQPRVLVDYLGLLLWPAPARLALFHDEVMLSTGLLSPPATLAALSGLAGAVILGLMARRRWPLLSLGLLWFVAAHSLEAGPFALEMYHEHRNYLPTIGLAVALSGALAWLDLQTGRGPGVILGLVLLGILFGFTQQRARIWSDEMAIIHHMVRHQPDSARAHHMMGEWYAKRLAQPLGAYREYEKAARLDPDEISYIMAMLRTAPLLPGQVQGPAVGELQGVTAHLQQRALSAAARNGLAELFDCAMAGLMNCVQQRDWLERWLRTALFNTANPDSVRLSLANDLSAWLLEAGRHEELLALTGRLRAELGARPMFELMDANALLLSGRAAEAEALLQRLMDSPAGARDDIREPAGVLLRAARQRQQQGTTAP